MSLKKVLMKNPSKMSLNERFTNIRKKQREDEYITARVLQERLALARQNERNNLLARRFEALHGLMDTNVANPSILRRRSPSVNLVPLNEAVKMSIKDRLGIRPTIKDRLGFKPLSLRQRLSLPRGYGNRRGTRKTVNKFQTLADGRAIIMRSQRLRGQSKLRNPSLSRKRSVSRSAGPSARARSASRGKPLARARSASRGRVNYVPPAAFNRSKSPFRGSFRGGRRGRTGFRGRPFVRSDGGNQFGRGPPVERQSRRDKFESSNNQNNIFRGRGNFRGRSRGGGRGFFRGRGARGGGAGGEARYQSNAKPTKEELDNQLEQYMSSGKGEKMDESW